MTFPCVNREEWRLTSQSLGPFSYQATITLMCNPRVGHWQVLESFFKGFLKENELNVLYS